jgi:hypothetical protein
MPVKVNVQSEKLKRSVLLMSEVARLEINFCMARALIVDKPRARAYKGGIHNQHHS